MSATDERLVRELYAEHAGVLLGYARQLLHGDTARAEDVVQETLLRAWRHPQALEQARREGRSIRGWLLTVARNLVIDGERARRARPQETAESPVALVADDPGFEQVLTADAVRHALRQLSPQHRDVIVELYYRDRSVADAARALGIPEGTVKSRTYHAMHALRRACRDQGVLE